MKRITAFFTSLFLLLTGLHAPVTPEPVFGESFPLREQTEFHEGDKTVHPYDLFVSPDGDDRNSGTADSPLRTPEAAQALLRSSAASAEKTVTVWFCGGEYTLRSPLTFTAEDRPNTVFRAVPGEDVRFVGAVPITDWSETTVNGVRAFETSCDNSFRALYKDGRRLNRPVYPKSGELSVTAVPKKDYLVYMDAVFAPVIAFHTGKTALNNFRNPTDIDVRVLHYWCDELLPAAKIDAEAGHIEVQKPSSMTIAKNDRFLLENVFESLCDPGEWYLDRSADKLYYIPEEGDTVENTVLYAPVTEKLLSMNGAKDIRFQSITFAYTDWSPVSGAPSYEDAIKNHPLGGNIHYFSSHSQAAYDVPSAMELLDCNKINFTHCTFRCIGYSALCFGDRSKNCTAQSCLFEDIGGNAVNIRGVNDIEHPDALTTDTTVTDCHIRRYGRIFNNAIGIFQSHAKNSVLSHNEIHDGWYSAISVGWVWGYGDSVTCGNQITDNLIYDIGQGWLSDMGGIYTLGKQPGTVISGNVIHDVGCYGGESGYGGWGVYLDEGSSGILVKNNLVYNCSSQGFHQHYGQNNLIENNIFALNKEGQLKVSRRDRDNSYKLRGNILLSEDAVMYSEITKKWDTFEDDGNLYWDTVRRQNVISHHNTFGQRKFVPTVQWHGLYKNGVFQDPLFKDAAHGDFNLATNSPALEMGFTPWNYHNAGTITKF